MKRKNKAKITRNEAAELLGITPQTVSYHAAQGRLTRDSEGLFTRSDVLRFNRKRAVDVRREKNEKEAADLRWRQARARREEILVEQLRKELISRDEVAKGWAERVGVVVSGLNALVDRLPPILEGKDRAEMWRLIKAEIYELRRAYAEEGEYCPRVYVE